MRPISRRPKKSNTITLSLTAALHDQLQAHAVAHNTTTATTLRNALRTFMDNPDAFQQPAHLTQTPIQRTRIAGLTINPKRDPDLRDRLEIYAIGNQLTASAVLRRAIYEYTKPTDPQTQPDPIATTDAWVDGYKPDTNQQPVTLRVIVTQPKPKEAPINTQSDNTDPNSPLYTDPNFSLDQD